MTDLFRRAESILQAASVPGATPGGTAIVLDRGGSMRILNSEGWTLMGLIREYGAAEVYMIRNSPAAITVEGWSTTQHCTVSQTQTTKPRPSTGPAWGAPYASQALALSAGWLS